MADANFVKAQMASMLRNPDLLHGAAGFFRNFARVALEQKGVPENVKQMLHTLGDSAEDIGVAMVANTPAAVAVPAAKVAEVKQRIEAAAPQRNESPGGAG